MPAEGAGVMDAVRAYLEAGKSRDFAALRSMHSADPAFSSFSDVPPYGMHDAETTSVLEEMRLAAISDYGYRVSDERVMVRGEMAVAAFTLEQSGMLVDNKTFSGESVTTVSRATFVLVREGTWKVAHMHVSRVPG
ncbi:MAG: nuclear transport factor 2 family protein [Thaumarchaeota archaeon]|nr:nuclear transport factor 2 family protein [Nitrososphaerota archaeon]MDD9813012.1 nuclear transport factor 2 family protein [Nitrososphaerota archaeon]MDD9842744.1 nuclear transport factor 2 family protein [Nitrososphaerota archaeon]RNJ71856.1 MAG: DUF4440 domain-containing protein [Thaumarchaeota archaeon S13]RNJ76842.1 MAG: DUF4440 domain-containing protein [Thaumarchaeota archaeon S15]